MPQLIVIALAGAAIYTGMRLIAKGIAHATAEASRAAEDIDRRAAEAAGTIKDLGTLEWDAAAGVYRPRGGPAS